MSGFKFGLPKSFGRRPPSRPAPAPAPAPGPVRQPGPGPRAPAPEPTPTLDTLSQFLFPRFPTPTAPWSQTPTPVERSGTIQGNDGNGIAGSYTTESGTGDDKETQTVGGSVTIDPAGQTYGGELDWSSSQGSGPTATGHQGGLSGSADFEENEFSVGRTDIDTVGGRRMDGTTGNVMVGDDSFMVSGMDYADGEGLGGTLGYDHGTGTGTLGGAYDNGRYSGGVTVAANEHTTSVNGNLGMKGRGGGIKVNGGFSVTTDEDFTQLIGEDASGRYDMARDTIGDDLVSYGLRDASSWNAGVGVDVKALSVSVAMGHSEGSSVQFMQAADALGLSEDELDDASAIQQAAADSMSDRVQGVNGPQDLDFVADGKLTDVLDRGTGWSFDNFDESTASAGLGLYGIGLTLGGTDHEYQDLTIARTSEGDDKIVVDFTTMDKQGRDARFGMDDVATISGSSTDTHSLNVQFELDPNDAGDLAALEKMTTTGLLPGAELALGGEDRQEYDALYADMQNASTVQGAADARERLAELSETANTAFLDDDDFKIGEVGAADYSSRREELALENRSQLSLLGFNAFSASVRERWWTEDYAEDGEQQRELGFEHEGSESHFLGFKTREAEESALSMNPRDNGNLAMVGGSEWKLTRDQAREFGELGLNGSDDWRMQRFADDDLHGFTGVGRASMAMDDQMLDATMDYWDSHNMNIWDDVSTDMAEDPMLKMMRGVDLSGYSDQQSYQILDSQIRHTDFIDHTDPEERLRHDPMTLLREEAKREAYRANADEILAFANDRMHESNFDTVDDLMDAMATGDIDVLDMMQLQGGGYSGGTILDGMAVSAYGEAIDEKVGDIVNVSSPKDFGGLNETEQEAWLSTYTQTSDKNGWYALDMVQGAVAAEEEKEGESDPNGLRDRLTRRLFREIERGTGDRDTATMEYIGFIGSLESWGGESTELANELKQGVQVAVYDEGVLERASEAADSLDRGQGGTSFQADSDFAGDLDREVDHLFDNNFREDKGDADDLMDRLEGLVMAAGPDSTAVIDQWLEHAATKADFPGAGTEGFVQHLIGQMGANDEYATKLAEVLAHSSTGMPNSCVAP